MSPFPLVSVDLMAYITGEVSDLVFKRRVVKDMHALQKCVMAWVVVQLVKNSMVASIFVFGRTICHLWFVSGYALKQMRLTSLKV